MKIKKIPSIPIVGMLLITALLAGCTNTNYQTPQLTITQPQNGATLSAGNITVTVQVSNFNLVNKLGKANVAGEGHIHYFLDVTPPTTPNQPATTAPGTYVATTEKTNTWTDIAAGMHNFSAELVNNDHTPLTPPIVSTIQVTIQGSSPAISITQPSGGASLPAGNITISVDVSNFNLVDKLGQPNVVGEGHIHYFIDVAPPTTPGQPAITTPGTYAPTIETSHTWQNVSIGQHTFSVELVNNDHTPLQPPVTKTVTVAVTSSGGGQTVVVYLKAQNMAFNRSSISVPAGATVIIHFTNDDSGVPHNFAAYTTSAATTIIFKGTIITGVSSTTYPSFIAPATPGTYFFRCDVHPSMMTGSFIVT